MQASLPVPSREGRGEARKLNLKPSVNCVLVLFVTDAPPSAAESFALITEGLCRVVAASHARGVAGPVIILIWRRLRRIAARFASLTARVRSGALPSPVRRRRAMPRPRSPRPPSPRLPRRFAWLIRLIPAVACHRSQLQHLLSDPEMAALLSAAPQMGRLLRPLCQMLGLRLPKCGSLSNSDGSREPAPAISAPVDPDPDRLSTPCGDPGSAANPGSFAPSSPTPLSRPPSASLLLPSPAPA